MFYLMMGFASVWLLVTFYLVYLGVRQRQLDAEMKALREELDASAHSQG
jgi:CcmD family protein